VGCWPLVARALWHGRDTDRGKLTFTSVTELDRENRQLVLFERHTLVENGQEQASDYQFVMRCWTRGELQFGLRKSGFSPVDYSEGVPVGSLSCVFCFRGALFRVVVLS
jgi:hypothetical protein